MINIIQRLRHSRGFGVHSPFAFNFILNVIHDRYWYYAFDDIDKVLIRHKVDLYDNSFHHLTYRLMRYFKPSTVLSVGVVQDVNLMYICYDDKERKCTVLDNGITNIGLLNNLNHEIEREFSVINDLENDILYDSVFVDLINNKITKEELFSVSMGDAFWVLYGINERSTKKLWKSIKYDKRVRVTFDNRNVGIVLLHKSYNKQNYLV